MPEYADKVFINGYIYTADRNHTVAEAIAVKGDKIVFVGKNSEAESWIGENTSVVDLKDNMMLPSFFEAHCHAQAMAHLMNSVNVTGMESLDEYLAAIRSFFEEHPDYEYILGNGWTNSFFPPEGPGKEVLDAISENLPIAIWSEDHHSLWVNSKALEFAGITRETPDPPGGIIEKNREGEPAGTLRESAADLVMDAIPDFTVEQYKDALKEYMGMANSLGFTGCFDAVLPVGGNAINAYKALSESGEMTMRIRGAYASDPQQGPEQLKAFIDARPGDSKNDLFQMNTVKIFADGVIEGATAYLTEPYHEGVRKPEGYRGVPIWEPDALKEVVAAAEKEGFQIHVHSIGDAATRTMLDAFEYATEQNGKTGHRRAITHIQIVDPADIPRFRKLDVIGIPNPYWMQIDDYHFNLHIPYLGEKRAEEEYPMQSFINQGVMLASASDFPVTDVPNSLFGIEIGVTRTLPAALREILTADPEDLRYQIPLWPQERVGVADMIDTFTYNGAYANFLEEETGSIEPGKSADLIILDQNLFQISATEIGETKVLLTMFRGREVFRDDSYSD